MADLKQFLDFAGLAEYDKLIKEFIKTGSTDQIEVLTAKNQEQDEQLSSINLALSVLNSDESVAGSVDSKVKTAVSALVADAPEALDTLKEIADWIADDDSGAVTLVNRVKESEAAIAELQEKNCLDGIAAIKQLEIMSLFPVKQAADESAAEAIANVEEGKAVELAPNQEISDDLVIEKSCYIDANGSTFTGTVKVPAEADVVIANATFSNPVVVE